MFGNLHRPQRSLHDQAQRAFAAHEQPGQIKLAILDYVI